MPTFKELFDFRDASFKGDKKWYTNSPHFAAYAPWLVLILAIFSIVEIVIGVVWITSIQSLGGGWGALTFPQVIQPLIIPALSFFNTIPSLHLHVLARSNHPLMALIFSSILAVIFIASAIVFLPPCVGDNTPPSAKALGSGVQLSGYQRTECPSGNNRGLWAVMVVLQFLTGIGYALHAAMAWSVRSAVQQRDQAIASGDLVEMVDEEEKRRREEEARQRWREMGNL